MPPPPGCAYKAHGGILVKLPPKIADGKSRSRALIPTPPQQSVGLFGGTRLQLRGYLARNGGSRALQRL